MDEVNRLWLLRQKYKNDYRYKSNQVFVPKHNEVLEEFYRLAGTWTLQEAAGAFIAGLWSAPFLWQSALTAKLISMVMPPHEHIPYGNSKTTCAVCGYVEHDIDVEKEWYFRMLTGTPLDGEPIGHVLALREMERIGNRPVPTEFDWWTFRAILTVIRSMPPKSRYSKVRDVLWKERLLPTSQKGAYGSLLEALALIGILDTKDYPGMAVRFTDYRTRDNRPNVRVEVQAPLAWWDSSVGIHEDVLKKIFPLLDCTPVDLENRPAPVPPLAQTVTGALEQKKAPRKTYPKSPDAGTGPAAAGDVYAVNIRENIWVTMYCYRVEGSYVVAEFLDGVFSEFPTKSQIQSTVRPRKDGRWQTKVSGIDRTPGVKRIARNIKPPALDLSEHKTITFSGAAEMKYLARWCFKELD